MFSRPQVVSTPRLRLFVSLHDNELGRNFPSTRAERRTIKALGVWHFRKSRRLAPGGQCSDPFRFSAPCQHPARTCVHTCVCMSAPMSPKCVGKWNFYEETLCTYSPWSSTVWITSSTYMSWHVWKIHEIISHTNMLLCWNNWCYQYDISLGYHIGGIYWTLVESLYIYVTEIPCWHIPRIYLAISHVHKRKIHWFARNLTNKNSAKHWCNV